jgi:MFS family permease
MSQTASLWAPLKLRDFRALWLGYSAFMLGNQFYFVALTWLLLDLTDSGALLGSVLMVAAVPRLIFMLVGGAVVDRVSPRPVLRVFSLAVTMIIGTLTLLLWREALDIGLLYVIAALIGMCDAFFYPAATASVPKMVDKAQLPAANALIQTGDQITQIAGPALAGVLIGLVGLPLAFALNTALFAIGAILLWLLRARSLPTTTTTAHSGNMLGSILEGLRYAWRDPAIRASLIIIGMLNFALVGPLTVGTAAMTETYFGGAGAYGLLMAAMGVGSLLGTLGAGVYRGIRHPGRVLSGLALLLGVCAVLLGLAQVLPVVALIMAVMGAGIGFTSVIATAWLQSRAAAQMQGRLMSVLMFSVVVFDPFSQGLAGVMLDVGLTAMFVGAGALLIVTGLATLGNKAIRTESEALDPQAVFNSPIEPRPE